mmetsp:Transcript_33856/g.55920  ORF Transcript_33856/g.55920 Transcript_33856/m.55920 type:complete len:363 (+) Transcript_33856:70-1158(+)
MFTLIVLAASFLVPNIRRNAAYAKCIKSSAHTKWLATPLSGTTPSATIHYHSPSAHDQISDAYEADLVRWFREAGSGDAEALRSSAESISALRIQQSAEDECQLTAESFEPNACGMVVLLRHGESSWNQANKFTGWHDVPLSRRGEQQAVEAARKLREREFFFDVVFCSQLKRTIKTAWLVLEELDDFSVQVEIRWQLNERMYGALTGLDKLVTQKYLGDARFEQIRRNPPPIEDSSCYNPNRNARLQRRLQPPATGLPRGESFEDAQKRVRPVWEEEILPQALAGKNVLVISSKNLLRSLFLEITEWFSLSDLTQEAKDAIVNVDIPNAVPIIFDPATGALQLVDDEPGVLPLLPMGNSTR